MINFEITPQHFSKDGNEDESLVAKIFPHPDQVCEGEYMTIYEFLLDPDITDDPALVKDYK